jgi:PST family polysaccharide transporter
MLKPLQYVSWSVGNVLFPAFSRLQDEKDRIRSAYIKVVRSISLLTFPMMLGLLIVSREFVLTFYGDKWDPVVIPLQLLSLIGAIQSIGTTVGIIFNSQGRSDLQLKWGVFASSVYVAAFLIGIHWGLIGLILMYMAVCFTIWPLSHYFSNRIIGLDMKTFFKSMLPAAMASILMVSVLLLLKYIYLQTFYLEAFFVLMILVPLGVILYAAFLQIFFKVPEVEELKNFLRRKLTSHLMPVFRD